MAFDTDNLMSLAPDFPASSIKLKTSQANRSASVDTVRFLAKLSLRVSLFSRWTDASLDLTASDKHGILYQRVASLLSAALPEHQSKRELQFPWMKSYPFVDDSKAHDPR